MIGGLESFSNFPVAEAASHAEHHRADRSRFAHLVNITAHYVNKPQPTPGTKSYAYESLGLVEFSPVGTGIYARKLMSQVAKQSYMDQKSVPTTGYGGLVAGNFLFQPLYDPVSNTYGGVPLA